MIFIITLSILLADQLAKTIISSKLSLNQSVPLIKGVFHITLVHNSGAAFGMLKGQLLLFIIISVFAVFLIFLALRNGQYKKPFLYNISLALILSGALGNMIDRLRFGYVIDFLDFRIWPVFNLADSAVTIGAVILGWSILRHKD
jgi:signal peptidase II